MPNPIIPINRTLPPLPTPTHIRLPPKQQGVGKRLRPDERACAQEEDEGTEEDVGRGVVFLEVGQGEVHGPGEGRAGGGSGHFGRLRVGGGRGRRVGKEGVTRTGNVLAELAEKGRVGKGVT